MDSTELKKLGHRLGHFLRRFDGGIKTSPSRAHFRTYIQGQLSDLERKSIAPIALQVGVAPLPVGRQVAACRNLWRFTAGNTMGCAPACKAL